MRDILKKRRKKSIENSKLKNQNLGKSCIHYGIFLFQQGFQHPQLGADALRSPSLGSRAIVSEGAVPAATPEPPVKGPLPPEHQVIQDVLNEVRNRCLLVVQNQVSYELPPSYHSIPYLQNVLR